MAEALSDSDADPIPDDAGGGAVLVSLPGLLAARRPRLVVTPAIIGLVVAVFAAMAASSGTVNFSSPTLVRWGGLFPPAVIEGDWWRLLSSVWLHGHPLHLILNLVFLWQIGSIVERMLGPAVFLVVYLLAGVLASAVSLQTLAANGVSVGASGAIFGIVGVLLAVAIMSRRLEGLGQLMTSLLTRLIAVVAANLAAGFYLPRVDNGAHLGGLAAGIFIGWLVGRDSVTVTPPLRRVIVPLALTALLASASIATVARIAEARTIAPELAAFEAVSIRAEASFRAAVADVRAGRRSAAEAADAVERLILPPLRAAEARSDALLRETQARFRATEDPRRLEPLDPRAGPWGRAYLDAYQWVIFLARCDEAWRLRLSGLRAGNAAGIADGDARMRRAAHLFAQRSTGPARSGSQP